MYYFELWLLIIGCILFVISMSIVFLRPIFVAHKNLHPLAIADRHNDGTDEDRVFEELNGRINYLNMKDNEANSAADGVSRDRT